MPQASIRRKEPAPRRLDDTRERILNAAENVFARYGYMATRVDDIAAAAGIRRPSLFHHFRSKQDLYVTVMNRAIEHLAAYFEKHTLLEREVPPERELAQMVDATFDFLVDHRDFSYLILHTLADNRIDEVPTEMSSITLDSWQAILDRGRSAGVFKDVSVGECIALVGGVTTFYITMPNSRTAVLKGTGQLNRQRIKQELQQMVRTLVLRD